MVTLTIILVVLLLVEVVAWFFSMILYREYFLDTEKIVHNLLAIVGCVVLFFCAFLLAADNSDASMRVVVPIMGVATVVLGLPLGFLIKKYSNSKHVVELLNARIDRLNEMKSDDDAGVYDCDISRLLDQIKELKNEKNYECKSVTSVSA